MIKSVTLNNFQAHKDTVVKFTKGINVIGGDSDVGKSALLRGIKACLFKTPFYTSWWAKDGFVEVELDDYTVRRECGVSVLRKCPDCKESISETDKICPNCKSYLSDKTSYDRYIFNGTEKVEKFGIRIPEQYLLKMRTYPMFFVDFEENLQVSDQHDDFFFIGTSYAGGTRNKILSSLIPDSSKVDVLIKNLNVKLSSHKSKYEFFEDTVKKSKKIIEDTAETFEAYKTLKAECLALVKSIETLEKEIQTLKDIQAKILKLQPKLSLSEKISKIAPAIEKIKEFHLKAVTMQTEHDDTVYLQGCIEKRARVASIRLESVDIPSVQPILDFEKSYSRVVVLKNTLSKIDSTVLDANTKLKTVNEQLKAKKSSIKETLCPLTGEEFCDRCKEILSE